MRDGFTIAKGTVARLGVRLRHRLQAALLRRERRAPQSRRRSLTPNLATVPLPIIFPPSLMPKAAVENAPGTSIWVKLSLLLRKPWVPVLSEKGQLAL